MTDDVKPCAHCGSEARSHLYVRDGGKVQCTNYDCLASVTQFNPDGAEKAITAWNTRTAPKEGDEQR